MGKKFHGFWCYIVYLLLKQTKQVGPEKDKVEVKSSKQNNVASSCSVQITEVQSDLSHKSMLVTELICMWEEKLKSKEATKAERTVYFS